MAADRENKLSPTTALQRADDLSVAVGVHENITVTIAERSVSAGSRGLAVWMRSRRRQPCRRPCSGWARLAAGTGSI